MRSPSGSTPQMLQPARVTKVSARHSRMFCQGLILLKSLTVFLARLSTFFPLTGVCERQLAWSLRSKGRTQSWLIARTTTEVHRHDSNVQPSAAGRDAMRGHADGARSVNYSSRQAVRRR